MIEIAEIKNFRGFEHVSLKGLSRINVLVGDNGAGKTAILEALFLAVARSAEVALRLRQWRGAEGTTFTGNAQEIYDGLFLDLFHNFNKDQPPSVAIAGTGEETKSLRIYYGQPTAAIFSADFQANVTGAFFPIASTRGVPSAHVPVTFEWENADGTTETSTPELTQQGFSIPPTRVRKTDAAFLAARAPFPTGQNAKWFSNFSKQGKEKDFVAAVQAQFPYIQTLTVEVDVGNTAVLYVKMPWMETKTPVYLASDGLNKLITVLLTLAHSTKTALFVDEIENGFHHSRHTKLWEQLLTFADQYETQLFISTHSWEFLKSAAPLMEKFSSDFSIIQVYQENGVGKAVVVPGKNAAAAIQNDLDLRGASVSNPPTPKE